MALFSNKEQQAELEKLRRELKFVRKENDRINEEKAVLEHKLAMQDGVFSRETPFNEMMTLQVENGYKRLKDIRSNLADVMLMADQLISYVQFVQEGYETVSTRVDTLMEKANILESFSKKTDELQTQLAERSQEIQIALTTVAENANKTREMSMDAALEAAKLGSHAHEFAVLADNIKDYADIAELNAKRAKGSFSRLNMSFDAARDKPQDEVKMLSESTTEIKESVKAIAKETDMRMNDLSEIVNKASISLKKMDKEIFMSKAYLTANTGTLYVEPDMAIYDKSVDAMGRCEHQLNKNVKQVLDTIEHQPMSIEVLKTVFEQMQLNMLEMFTLIDAENNDEEVDSFNASAIVSPIEESVESVALEEVIVPKEDAPVTKKD